MILLTPKLVQRKLCIVDKSSHMCPNATHNEENVSYVTWAEWGRQWTTTWALACISKWDFPVQRRRRFWSLLQHMQYIVWNMWINIFPNIIHWDCPRRYYPNYAVHDLIERKYRQYVPLSTLSIHNAYVSQCKIMKLAIWLLTLELEVIFGDCVLFRKWIPPNLERRKFLV